jgi:transposase
VISRRRVCFSYVSCEARVPTSHPLRAIRAIVEEVLEILSPDFESMYSAIGRPSTEKLQHALLLRAFYTIRSERQLMEQMDYNLRFRWFVELSMDAPIWDVTVFTKNRAASWRVSTPEQKQARRRSKTRPLVAHA